MALDFLRQLGLGVAGIAITVFVLSSIAGALTDDSVEQNLIEDMISAFSELGTWLPIIVIVSMAVLVFAFVKGMGGTGKQ